MTTETPRDEDEPFGSYKARRRRPLRLRIARLCGGGEHRRCRHTVASAGGSHAAFGGKRSQRGITSCSVLFDRLAGIRNLP
ncbi:hypothetical protein [Actinomadura rudentiformis]|uniref:Uncharacterized protein n=1 Tax=Actinomadura rudentiformis TaxID=359158 RepID=A0A6H9Z112_9ACTN|nr:hypothetical protein [Actinomadura rudentiformis]KAB2346815.1 hypothetical protein F8566_21555 [Actinomadura rudentiformis]